MAIGGIPGEEKGYGWFPKCMHVVMVATRLLLLLLLSSSSGSPFMCAVRTSVLFLVATLSYGIVAFALRCSLTSQLPARVCGSFDELSLMFVCFLISAEYSIEYIY